MRLQGAGILQQGRRPSAAAAAAPALQVRELSLTANQLRSEAAASRLRFKPGPELGAGKAKQAGLEESMPVTVGGGESAGGQGGLRAAGEGWAAGAGTVNCESGCGNGELLVRLSPMEIRTFELVYGPVQQ